MKIILASQSERRKNLLKQIFDNFEIVVPDTEEIMEEMFEPAQIAMLNAEKKAKSAGRKIDNKNCLIISADTVVVVNNRIFGKPSDFNSAFEYLKILSGTIHRVITGCCLFFPAENKIIMDYETSYVKFRHLTDQQIVNFLKKDTFLDKAGGYAVQEIGDEFVEEIRGSYDNVVGLPLGLLKKMLDDFKNLRETEIIDIGFPNSSGVGKYSGKTIFIENATVGDIAWFRVKREKSNFSIAENCGIKKYSNLREDPFCPHFGICGGCTLQNLKYDFQLELKTRYLVETLSRIGKIQTKPDLDPMIASPVERYYRNKMEFAFGLNGGKMVLGLRQRYSPLKKYRGYVNKLDCCPIFADFVNKLFPFFIRYAEQNNLEPYNPFTKKGYIRHLVLRHAKNTGQIMAIIATRSGIHLNLGDFAKSVVNQIPEIVSFWWVENDQLSDVVSFQKKHLIYGRTFIEEKIKGLRFKIYPEAFFQPNTGGAARLYETILSLASTVRHKKILGLFCGSGPIEIFLSRIAEKVIGVDNNPANIQTAIENCRDNGIENCEFFCLSAEEFLKKETVNQNKYDIVVLDPPRSGLTGKAIRRIIDICSESVIYVSCNPATLARDIAIFCANGYQIKRIIPVDMFPHTTHIETCCLLQSS
ncbi:MAG: 23S rRNA (uracil(1939)-C(5))-methyltransferase RlmD [Candidatus Omnitrophica bacterium]|nr:23S rRNA (uracil(1939)-C(5))-methyltransferase RlmD [Candidatus Omnitrophota bacterium]